MFKNTITSESSQCYKLHRNFYIFFASSNKSNSLHKGEKKMSCFTCCIKREVRKVQVVVIIVK